MTLEPNSVGAHFNLGNAYEALGEEDAAARAYQRLVRLLRHVRGWRRRPFSLREWTPARFAADFGLHRLVGTIRYPGQVNAT